MELLKPVGIVPMRMVGVTGTNLDLRKLTPLWFCVWMRSPFRTSLKSPSPPTAMILWGSVDYNPLPTVLLLCGSQNVGSGL